MAQALMTERQNQRAHSLGSLARSALAITVWAVAIMTILSIAGINVAPLLASAGVLGVVLGFGAQTLVADYLAGIAMIFEDQLGIGDTIDLGVVLGEVEEVALRYTRVRDSWGVVWYVRNGTIQYVANQSQGWTYALVEIPVPYNEDLEKVQQVIDAAGKEMLEDPDYNVMLLGAPYYSALQEVTATSAIIRVNTKVVPDGNQWYAARVIRQQMKQALDDAGIRIPLDGIEIRTVQAQAAARPGRAPSAERQASLKDPDAGKRHP
jgi:small conductance mechanosensitive channel